MYLDKLPKEAREFLDKIQALCDEYKISISHEDNQGAFILRLGDKDPVGVATASIEFPKEYNVPRDADLDALGVLLGVPRQDHRVLLRAFAESDYVYAQRLTVACWEQRRPYTPITKGP